MSHSSAPTSPNSDASCIALTLEASLCRLQGAFVMSMSNHPVFSSNDVRTILTTIQNEGVRKTIDMTVAPEKKLLIKDVQKAAKDCGMFAPATKWDDSPAIAEEQEDQSFLDQQPTHQMDTKRQQRSEVKVGAALAPTEDDVDLTTPFLDTHTSRATSCLQHPDSWSSVPNI